MRFKGSADGLQIPVTFFVSNRAAELTRTPAHGSDNLQCQSMSSPSTSAPRASEAWFRTTHWSVVLSAQDKSSPQSDQALESLCRTYWYPLYAFVRRQGQSPADAEDLVQEFFARLLAKDYLAVVDREKGRFRTFLVMAMKRFLANEWDRLRTQKRGGGQAALPLDAAQAEIRYQEDASLSRTAHMAFDREWAVTLLHQTLNRLRQEHERLGSGQDFEVISRFLTVGKESIPYGQTAVQLGISEAAARMAVHRLRRRFREVVREEVAQTVAGAEEVDEEIRYLIEILSQ